MKTIVQLTPTILAAVVAGLATAQPDLIAQHPQAAAVIGAILAAYGNLTHKPGWPK